jgi:hypothetical protein
MGLTQWQPEINFGWDNKDFKAYNQAWFDHCWTETDSSEKLVFVDSEMPLGMAAAYIGMDQEGIPNWQPYSPLRVMLDPMKRRPKDLRYCFFIDEMDVDDVVNIYGVSEEEVNSAGTMLWKSSKQDGSLDPVRRSKIIRVYKYYSHYLTKNGWRGSHCVIIGSIRGRNSIWLTLDRAKNAAGYLAYRKMGDTPAANPYPFLPIEISYEMVSPGVRRPVGRAHWDASIGVFMQRIMKSVANDISAGGTIRILSAMGIDEDTIDRLKRAQTFDDESGRILVADIASKVMEALDERPAVPIPQDRMEWLRFLAGELNESSGVSDAQRDQRNTGMMTAFEFSGRQDAQGIQMRHARQRRAQFISGLIEKLRKCAALYDTRPLDLEFPDGLRFSTKNFPLAPFLGKDVKISVTEDSMAQMGHAQRSLLAIERFKSVDLPLIQLGAMDPIVAAGNLVKEVYGTTDPSTRGVIATARPMLPAMGQGLPVEQQGQAQAGPPAPDQGDSAPRDTMVG